MTTPEYREGKLQDQVNELTAQLEAIRKEVVRLRDTLNNAKIEHITCEDPWCSCPLSEEGCADERQVGCSCGADNHNAVIDEALASTTITPEWEHNWMVGKMKELPVAAWRAPNFSSDPSDYAYRDADDRPLNVKLEFVGEPLYVIPKEVNE